MSCFIWLVALSIVLISSVAATPVYGISDNQQWLSQYDASGPSHVQGRVSFSTPETTTSGWRNDVGYDDAALLQGEMEEAKARLKSLRRGETRNRGLEYLQNKYGEAWEHKMERSMHVYIDAMHELGKTISIDAAHDHLLYCLNGYLEKSLIKSGILSRLDAATRINQANVNREIFEARRNQ